jgi:hypothetical protein
MTRHTLVLALLVLAAAVPVTAQRQPDQGKRPDDLMKRKLEQAQKVLEGVATNNFDLIERGADELQVISKRAEWRVLQTPDYNRQSDEFRRHAAALTKAAREKNTDAAALAYVQMTMSCVNCHKYVREARIARAGGD